MKCEHVESLFVKTIADVLKSESHLSLLKLGPAMMSTGELHATSKIASLVRHPVKWLTCLTG